MLADNVFSIFDNERYKYHRDILENPEKEINVDKDLDCRKNNHLLDKAYKCAHCSQINKIARTLPCFTVETGERKGQRYKLEKILCPFYFSCFKESKIIYYDNFRGSVFISVLLEVLGLPTIDCVTCAFSCQGNCILKPEYSPLTEFNLTLAKQLLVTLKVLEGYKFVFDDLNFYVAKEKVSLLYEGLRASSPDECLKISGWENCSLSFNSHRIVAGKKIRSLIMQNHKPRNTRNEWFRAFSFCNDIKHHGDTRFNIYNCFIKLRPLMTPEVIELWKELWKPEEYDLVESSLKSGEFSFDYFFLRSDALNHLYEKVK